ncbi:class III lanthionine synthetase LanKC [Nocardiopsis sp. ATB16-24]|uniref:class III lanthionine synthetase LanKC n=1 Tax=Nocardiopsis sp. ATB16-24 TaxID=3019555 RepID=UPI0025561961|nr:class III lanthionine synthetase LanKC [Nocardiopsis sp. ATB16-24]
MLDNMEIYVQADSLFYEDPRHWARGPKFLDTPQFSVSGRECPPGWSRTDHGLWTYVFPEATELPDQGWKIHVSATLDNGDALCNAVWDYCTTRGIPFKHLLDRKIQYLCNSKYAPRGSSGKLITIYPRDEAELESILTGLSERVEGQEGPYILSDLRWGEGPLYVRYGAFADLRCVDADGRSVPAIRRPDGVLVPDKRRPGFTPPSWARLPAFLEPHLQARGGGGGTQPYRVDKALHFSNSGGVYLATRLSDGEEVVLKEARPHAGVDGNGDDAVTRQEREEKALRRLDGIRGIPRLHDAFTLGGHRFIVQEYREGLPLYSWCAAYHPRVIKADPPEKEVADFTARLLEVLRRVEEIVAAIHERGLVAGDLHMNNVLVGPDDEVTVIDFEQAFEIGEEWRPGLGAPGFATAHRQGTGIDEHALAMLRLTSFLAFAPITSLAPAKAEEYIGIIEREFPVSPAWIRETTERLELEGSSEPDPAREAASPEELEAKLAAAVVESATPDREDRLFPGDIQQFVSGGLGIAYGAAGVLWVLDVCGHGRHPEFERWLISAARREKSLNPGFYDGAAGIAYVLDRLGHREEAAQLLERYAAAPRGGVSLFSGLSGIGASLLHFAESHDDSRHRDEALELANRIGDHVTSGKRPGPEGTVSGLQAGLMRGWSGAALFYLRLHEHTSDPSCLDLALRAVHRDLDQCVTNDDGALVIDDRGVRGLPHIEAGGLGLALVVDEVLAYREDDRLREALPALARSGLPQLTVRGDLFFGKAGQLAAMARIGKDDQAVRRRTDELRRYLVPYRDHLALPSGRGFRLSMDLATGTAGALLALAAARGGGSPFLPFFRTTSADTDLGGTE